LALSIDIFLLLLIWALFSYALRLAEKCKMSVYITTNLDFSIKTVYTLEKSNLKISRDRWENQ